MREWVKESESERGLESNEEKKLARTISRYSRLECCPGENYENTGERADKITNS